MTRQAVILAGGLGTRLRTVIGNVPKALAEVGGKPVLGHQLELCHRHGFDDVVLLLGHEAAQVQDYVGDGSHFGLSCRSVIEDRPLGTAGAVLAAKDLLQDDILVLYCDTMLDIDLERFWRFFERRKAAAALLVHPNDHPFDSDLVVTDAENRVTGFSRWREDAAPLRNLASAALYVMNKKILESVSPREGTLDFGRHVFPELIARGETLFAYRSVEYIKDLGTPERLEKVNRDYAVGKVAPQRSGRPRAAMFIDRDGVLNVERNGVLDPGQMELLPGAADSVRRLNKAGLATVVVTNQPCVSHGTLSEAKLDAVHAAMERDLAHNHAFVDAIYYCPHHPHKGYEGERVEFKIDCNCRKPKPGMILKAADELCLDLAGSWMIGDRTGDIGAAKAAGVRSILVRGGHGGRDGANDVEPDFTFEDLPEAVEFILDAYPVMRAFCAAFIEKNVRPGAQILVGGQARTGKSTWARILAEVLREKGFDAVTLPLDAWLRDLSDRGPDVLARYDLCTVSNELFRLRSAEASVEIAIPVYDRAARRRIGENSQVVPFGAVVICEGAPALAIEAPGALRLAAFVSETARRARFDAFYRWRNESGVSERYWNARLLDEAPIISQLCSSAEELPTFEAKS
ncbi:HAD-IIIA family hydrolase [Rhodoblastus sp.]|uniref:HAD-IIIA family hydrolase n=1 Tax=Rhodoblastus sp. TaxID=1962975 RepID=UPI0035B0AE40